MYYREDMCGGSDTSLDTSAPKEIKSDDMILFDVSSKLNHGLDDTHKDNLLYAFSCFAAKTAKGSFVYYQKDNNWDSSKRTSNLAYVKKDIFQDLAKLANECNLAKNNGYHSHTHGLPEDFGGTVRVLYSSGEKISFSDNSSPILSYDTGCKICGFFEKAAKEKKVQLPNVDELSEIRYHEEHSGGGYTKAVLSICEDGTGINKKESKYDTPTVYTKESRIDKKTIAYIKETIGNSLLFAWPDLLKSPYEASRNSRMTFAFKNGDEITVRNDRELPAQINDAFFKIQLEIVTKH